MRAVRQILKKMTRHPPFEKQRGRNSLEGRYFSNKIRLNKTRQNKHNKMKKQNKIKQSKAKQIKQPKPFTHAPPPAMHKICETSSACSPVH